MKATGSVLLMPKLCRHCLQLFDECVAGIVARHRLCTIIDDIDLAGRIIINPGADILWLIWSDGIKADFEQYTITKAFHGLDGGRICQLDPRASVTRHIVKFCIAFDASDPINLDGLRQPVVKVGSCLDLRGTVLVLSG